MVTARDIYFKQAKIQDLTDLTILKRLGFKPGIRDENINNFVHTMRAFPGGFLMMKLKPHWDNIGYVCNEIWREYPQSPEEMQKHFDLNHDIDHTHYPYGELLYICSMVVHPMYQGMHLGHLLLEECLTKLPRSHPKLKGAVLIVNEEWLPAVSICKYFGFKEKDRINGFFKAFGCDAKDGIIMEKNL
jgi:ribosomal protein S18 acetylase RimI-like enzyme